jgi:hypothetical protein
MDAVPNPRLAVLFLGLLCFQCGSLQRDNPLDPDSASPTESAVAPTLSLVIPLPKALAAIVDRIVARLEAPGMLPIVKELHHTPLGPATLVIGAISPGSGRALFIEGFDFDGQLILTGEARNIEVVVGDTTRVIIDLQLVASGKRTASDSGGSGKL